MVPLCVWCTVVTLGCLSGTSSLCFFTSAWRTSTSFSHRADMLLMLFSHSVVSDSLQLHGLQHTRLPCPSPSPKFAQTHVPWVSDAIQPSHPLSSPSLPAFNLSQRQGLSQWISSSHQVATVIGALAPMGKLLSLKNIKLGKLILSPKPSMLLLCRNSKPIHM